MNDATSGPVATAEASAPRLSIAHLMLLTLTTAIAIAVVNLIPSPSRSGEELTQMQEAARIAMRVWQAAMIGSELARWPPS